jgi:hypothetical protein
VRMLYTQYTNKSVLTSSAIVVRNVFLILALQLAAADVPPVILEDFEDVSDMRVRTARAASARITTAPDPVRSGKHSGSLQYDFTNAEPGTSAAYAEHRPLIAIPGRPLRIGVWVHGNGSRTWLQGFYRDGNNTQKQLLFTILPGPDPLTKDDCRKRNRGIDWEGWKYVEAPIPADAVFPLKWERLSVAETNDICDAASGVFFDDLRAVYSDTEDLVAPAVRDVFPAPDSRVYTSTPEIGGLVEDGADRIRLTVDDVEVTPISVLLPAARGEGARRADEGISNVPSPGLRPPSPRAAGRGAKIVRYTPATPLADGRHRVRLEAFDRAGNAAIPSGDWTFTIFTGPDKDPPVIDRAQPFDGTTSLAGRPRLSARIRDRGIDPAGITMVLDGKPVTAVWDAEAEMAWYAPRTPLAKGKHAVTLRVRDRGGNSAATSWAFHVAPIAQPAGPFRFTWIADGGYFEKMKETAATAILGEHLTREKVAPPHLLVFGGDIVENDQEINYERARAALAGVGAPALVAAGNHEISGSLSRTRFWRTFGPTIAAVDLGSIDILLVDVAASSFIWDTSQYVWLERELAQSDARTLFLVLHAPTRDPFGSGHGVLPPEGKRVEAILAAAKAAKPARDIVVLSGDAHAYARWMQDGVHYLISGGGGGGLDAIPSGGGWYHRLHISIDGKGVAKIDVIPLLESIIVTTMTLQTGESKVLTATGDFFTASAPDITLPVGDPFARVWTSSDANVATVDAATGLVRALSPGQATITIVSGGATATATVTVK